MNFVERRELLKLIEKLLIAGTPTAVADHVIWKTKGGRSVRILCTDKPGRYPIVGYFIDATDKIILHWTAAGRSMGSDDIRSDLIIPDGFTVGATDKTEAGDLK